MTNNNWCPDCKETQSFGKYCVRCGKELQSQITCGCGEEIRNYFKFCPKCGKEIIADIMFTCQVIIGENV